MGNLTSTLTVRLLDLLSGPAKAAVRSLRDLDAAARGAKGGKPAALDRTARGLADVNRQAVAVAKIAKAVPAVTVGDPVAIQRSAKGLAETAKQASAVARAGLAIEGVRVGSPLADLSAGLRAHLVGLGLTRREYRSLARDFVRMKSEQAAAVAGIANPKVRARVQAEDGARIEGRLRDRAGRMASERQMTDTLSGGSEGSARAAAAEQRRAAAERLRASREQARAQREAERSSERAAIEAARSLGRAERDAAREKVQAAREAARLARQAERDAERGGGQAAKAEAQAARSAAREKVQAARESAAAMRQAEREATAAAVQGARDRARAARESAAAMKAAAREQAAATQAATREQRRADRDMARSRRHSDVAAGLGAGVVLYNGSRAARYAGRMGADGARENARDYLAGIEGDSPRIARKALDLSTRFPSVDANTFHERLRDTALAMGSTDKAFDVSDTIGRSSVVLQSLKGKDRSIEEGRRFFSALDNLGKNQDPAQVQRLMDGWIKALGVEGADLDMGALLAMARTAKSGGAGLSEKFLMTTAPSLMMDMGPSRLGTALGSEVAQIIGGRATKSAKAYQQQLGMRDTKGEFSKSDRDLITSDPYSYTINRLIPMLQSKGVDVNNNAAVVEAMAKAFSNQVVADLFTKMISQREQYDRKREQYDKAPGIDSADKLQTADPYVAAASAVAQFGNAVQQLAEPLVPAATSALNGFATAMGSFAKGLADNPEIAKGAAPAAAVVTASTLAVMAGRAAQAIAGQGTGLAANALRLGGQTLTGAGSVLPWMTLPAGVLGGGYLDATTGGNEGAIGAMARRAFGPKQRVRPGWRSGETSGQRLLRASREARYQERAEASATEAMRGVSYPAGWEQPGRRGSALGDAGDTVSSSMSASRGMVGDFLLGLRRDTFGLPGFGFRVPMKPAAFESPRRPADLGGSAVPTMGRPLVLPMPGPDRAAAPVNRPPQADPVPTVTRVDTKTIADATAALTRHRAEMASLDAQPTGEGQSAARAVIEARRMELRRLIGERGAALSVLPAPAAAAEASPAAPAPAAPPASAARAARAALPADPAPAAAPAEAASAAPPAAPAPAAPPASAARAAPAVMPNVSGADAARSALRTSPVPAPTPGGEVIRSSLAPDVSAIQAATSALGAYRAELASIKADLATGLDMPGIGTGLEARKAELEGLIAGVEAKLQGLGAQTITPRVDAAPIDGLGTSATAAGEKLAGLNTTVSPQVDMASLSALDALLTGILGKVRQLGPEMASAKAQAASISVPSVSSGGGSRLHRSVRQELSNNHI